MKHKEKKRKLFALIVTLVRLRNELATFEITNFIKIFAITLFIKQLNAIFG